MSITGQETSAHEVTAECVEHDCPCQTSSGREPVNQSPASPRAAGTGLIGHTKRLLKALANTARSADGNGDPCWCRDRREMDVAMLFEKPLSHQPYCAEARELLTDKTVSENPGKQA